MSTRVTTGMLANSALTNLQSQLSATAKLQDQLSSGKRISKPSDDPSGTVSALQMRQQLRLNDQYSRNINDGTGWLNQTDSALMTASNSLISVRSSITQALNWSNQTSDSLGAISASIDGVKSQLVSLANTQYNGRAVFSGTSSGTAVTVDSTATPPTYTWAQTGTAGVQRQIDATTAVQVDTDGRTIFGDDASGTSVF
ncbi:flagellar hook-associated protein FlgL, partial [Enterococcus hirae]|uniref:flagellar hook-associated protein FlgL n=1 Tax=Enterococcus hirae TaxID=1354 RepID=UPI0013717124